MKTSCAEASNAQDNGTSCCPSGPDAFESCHVSPGSFPETSGAARSSVDDVVPVQETQATATTMSGMFECYLVSQYSPPEYCNGAKHHQAGLRPCPVSLTMSVTGVRVASKIIQVLAPVYGRRKGSGTNVVRVRVFVGLKST